MPYLCPQCGAPAETQIDSRFYRCGWCGSSCVVQGEEGGGLYACSHRRDDRIAWSALAEYLEGHGVTTAVENGTVEFLTLPFWCLTLESGAVRMIPAVPPPLPEVTDMTLPGSDLRFPLPEEALSPPVVSLADAERAVADGAITRRFLLHLPLYLLSYSSRGAPFQALVSGADRKVYARSLPPRSGIEIPRHHLLMVGVYVLLLIVEGVAIRRLEWRALAFLLTGLAAWPLGGAILRREC